MRLLRFLFFYVPLGVCGAILILLLIQNWRPVRLDLFGPQYSISLTWVLVAAMAVGAFAAAFLLLPGRLAATVRAWSLERELRRYEQDLWRLQERRERLLIQHERLLEAHERMLLAHQDLVEEHSLVLAERDEALAQVNAPRAIPSHQPAREPIPLARVARAASASTASADSAAAITVAAATTAADDPGPHVTGTYGAGSGSAPLPRRATPPPRSVPLLLTEPTAISPAAASATPPLSLSSSPHHAAARSSAAQISFLMLLRSRLRADIAESAAALAALRATLEARLARLKRSLPLGRASTDPSSSTPGTRSDLPGGDDRG